MHADSLTYRHLDAAMCPLPCPPATRAPTGAARFEELVNDGFFTDIKFFRVVSGFMAQFGIAGDPAVAAKWRTKSASKPVTCFPSAR